MQIQVEVLGIEKPYIGGFRNPKNGKIYHNAFTNTDQIKREHKTKFERDVLFSPFNPRLKPMITQRSHAK